MKISSIHDMCETISVDVRLSVIIKNIIVVKTDKGEDMAFALAEDETGTIDCVFFPSSFSKFKGDIFEQASVLLEGAVNLADKPRKIFANNVKKEIFSE